MSRSILRALIQLFALVAKPGNKLGLGRNILENFLKRELGREQVDEYLQEFDQYMDNQSQRNPEKQEASSSVRVLRLCTRINEELTHPQKCFVYVRLNEFLSAGDVARQSKSEFLEAVASTFNIEKEEQELIELICHEWKASTVPGMLLLGSEAEDERLNNVQVAGMEGHARLIYLSKADSYYIRYDGEGSYYLNGQIMSNAAILPFPAGSVIRGNRIAPLYYSDLANNLRQGSISRRIVFQASNVEFAFKNGKKAIHRFNLTEHSGHLIGIMGSSGAGKSTLLNVLNGNELPSSGQVSINGIDIHRSGNKASGMIGYVSQDDTLIEELTVYQNLWYNALLCFEGMDKALVKQKVEKTLNDLGLNEIASLKVGSPLNKVISGGQRKRLNLALELIREPPVIFLDEPTSGLSSRDSENLMDLLKDLAIKGKLVFVVIHQPSSNIFKLFDRLILLDVGGYPIYYGNPVESVRYFRSLIDHVKAGEAECPECGNVNPEQLFDILESRVVDERGQITDKRKISPREWNMFFKRNPATALKKTSVHSPLPEDYRIPGRKRQFSVFFFRDLRAKISNRQYLLLNLLEAPLLALIMGYFLKYSDTNQYSYYHNLNIPAYFFICIISSLFFGLTVSAEEIFKDRRIRRRERFLNLSQGTYLASKTSLLFLLSAIQSFCFIAVGHSMLQVDGLWFDDWMILFSVAAFSNLLGLNISSAFNSVITIYILVPLLIIPQILLSGVMVKFEYLNTGIPTRNGAVPFAANLMATRWAFEAMTVNRFTQNPCQKPVLADNIVLSESAYLNNYWIPRMQEFTAMKLTSKEEEFRWLSVLRKESTQLNERKMFRTLPDESLRKSPAEIRNSVEDWLQVIQLQSSQIAANRLRKKDALMSGISYEMVQRYENEKLNDMLRGSDELDKIRQNADGTYWRNFEPIFSIPEKGFFAGGQLYMPFKAFFGNKLLKTRDANLLVIWLMTLILGICLYFNILARLLEIKLDIRRKSPGIKPGLFSWRKESE